MDGETTRPPTVGELLRRCRLAAGLTQQALAERAQISARTLGEMERGSPHRARKETLRLLCDALGLSPAERAAFMAIARTHGASPDPLPPPHQPHLPLPLPLPLPVPTTPLVGRAADIAGCCTLLQSPATRLLTLVGPPGVGKTRLALALAVTLRERFSGGVAFVPLAPVRDPSLVVATIAQVVFKKRTDDHRSLDQLCAYLCTRQMLLLLDNFEHLPLAAPDVAHLLAVCPLLTILVTSRAAIHIRGEREYPVVPLALPAHAALPLDDLARSPAVALFVERAQAVRPGFRLTACNASAVAEICRRVDGLPLALELAAERIRLFPPEALLARLGSRLRVLTHGASDLPERQRTLRTALAWSYDLLTPPQQTLFRRLSVFVGGASLAALRAVASALDIPGVPGANGLASRTGDSGDTGGESCDHEWLADELMALLDQHLIETEPISAYDTTQASIHPEGITSPSELRFTLLDTIREFAYDQLLSRGERDAVERAHAISFLSVAQRAEPYLRGPAQQMWLETLEREHANLRAALAWAVRRDEVEVGLPLAVALWWLWYVRGYLGEIERVSGGCQG